MQQRLILLTLSAALVAAAVPAGAAVPREETFRYSGFTLAATSDMLREDCDDATNFGGGCVELDGSERILEVRVEDDTGHPVAFAVFLDTMLRDVYCGEATDIVVLLGTEKVHVTIMDPAIGTLRCSDGPFALAPSTPTQGTITLAFT